MNGLQIRPAQPADSTTLLALIQELAEYENLTHQVTGTVAELKEHLFGPRPYAEALVATVDVAAVGYALFFYSYSTFLTQPGLYLEDLYVRKAYRQRGIGTALLKAVAQVAQDRDCGRLEWSVLDWNAAAIDFYTKMGATILPDWRTCRVTDFSPLTQS